MYSSRGKQKVLQIVTSASVCRLCCETTIVLIPFGIFTLLYASHHICQLFCPFFEDCTELNTKEITVCLQGAICFVCKNLFGKNLTQLHTFLVKAVYIPDKALEHDLVLKVRKKGTHCLRCQLLTNDNAGRTIALKFLIIVLIFLTAGKSNNLCHHICAKLLLASASLDIYIHTTLAVLEANKL